MNPWLDLVLFTGAAQGGLLVVVILSMRSSQPLANALLAAFVGVNSYGLLLRYFSNVGVELAGVWYVLNFVLLFQGPLIYLYVRALAEPSFRLGTGQWVHLWPAALNVALFMWLQADAREAGLPMIERQNDPLAALFAHLISIAYGLGALQVLSRHRSAIEAGFSSHEDISLSWLRWLLVFFVVARLPYTVIDVLRVQGDLELRAKSYSVAFFHLLVVYVISIGGMRQSSVFTRPLREALAAVTEQAQDEAEKYERSGLDDSLVDGVWQQLEQAMAQRQLYLRSSLTLAELAAELGHSGNELSQVINSRSGGNFFEYVNRYRVEQAKALLAQPQYQEQKMLAIALDAGFNSQSTFYTHFRKHTGVTPRQYRQQLGR